MRLAKMNAAGRHSPRCRRRSPSPFRWRPAQSDLRFSRGRDVDSDKGALPTPVLPVTAKWGRLCALVRNPDGTPVRERNTPGVHQLGVGRRCEPRYVRNKVCLRKPSALATSALVHNAANAAAVVMTEVMGIILSFVLSSRFLARARPRGRSGPDQPLFSSENAAANRPGSTDSEHCRGKVFAEKASSKADNDLVIYLLE